MKMLIVLAASLASAVLVLPTVSQAQTVSSSEPAGVALGGERPCHHP